jgi:hypothetical protein
MWTLGSTTPEYAEAAVARPHPVTGVRKLTGGAPGAAVRFFGT